MNSFSSLAFSLCLAIVFSACDNSSNPRPRTPDPELIIDLKLSNGYNIFIKTSNPDFGFRIYFPNHFSGFTGFDATKFDYVSSLTFYPWQILPDSNSFLLDVVFVIPTTDSLLENVDLPHSSSRMFIESSPDSAGFDNLFDIGIDIELKSNDDIEYYSYYDPTVDTITQQLIVDSIFLLKPKANHYFMDSIKVFTDYYAVSGTIETLMRHNNYHHISPRFPGNISLKGDFTFIVEVRNTD